MTEPDGEGPDPVFNDFETGGPAARSATGETIVGAATSSVGHADPEGGESHLDRRDPGRQIVRVFVENKLAVVGVGGHRLHGAVLLRGAAPLPHQPDQPAGCAAADSRPTRPRGNGHPLGPTAPASTSSAA